MDIWLPIIGPPSIQTVRFIAKYWRLVVPRVPINNYPPEALMYTSGIILPVRYAQRSRWCLYNTSPDILV